MISSLWNIETLISSRLRRLEKQAEELQQLSSKSEEAIDQLLKQAQRDKIRYQSSINAYKQSRAEFTAHGKILLQASLRSRERFWDIRVPKIDSIFDNSLVPRPSWSPGVPPQHRKLVAATHRSPI